MAFGIPAEENAEQIGELAPIAFDTRNRYEDTPIENYVQFWCTTGNTIPFDSDKDVICHRHSSKVIQTGICISGKWKISAQSHWRVRTLLFHSSEPLDNGFVVNPWLRGKRFSETAREDIPPIPAGVHTKVFPCVEGTAPDEAIYMPYANWYSRHMWQTCERREELFKVIPTTTSGKPVRVLADRFTMVSNNSNRAKQRWFNMFVKMHHKYYWESKYGAFNARSDGGFDTEKPGKGLPNNVLYVMVMAMCVVPGIRMGDPNIPEDMFAGIEEWPMAQKVGSRDKGKHINREGSVASIAQRAIISDRNITPRDLAERQLDTALSSASHFRKGTRKVYEGTPIYEINNKVADMGDNDNIRYQESWDSFSNRERPIVTRVFAEGSQPVPVREGSISRGGYRGPMPGIPEEMLEASVKEATIRPEKSVWKAVPTPILVPGNPVAGPSRFSGAMGTPPPPSASAIPKRQTRQDTRKGAGGFKAVPYSAETNEPLRIRGGADAEEAFYDDADEPAEPEPEAPPPPPATVEPPPERAVVEVVPDDAYKFDPLYNGPKFARLELHGKMRVFFRDAKDYYRR